MRQNKLIIDFEFSQNSFAMSFLADHHWPLMGHGRDEYRIHDLLNSPPSSFDGFTYEIPEDLPSRSVEFSDPDDCLLNPKKCKDGLAVEFSIQGISSVRFNDKVLLSTKKCFS